MLKERKKEEEKEKKKGKRIEKRIEGGRRERPARWAGGKAFRELLSSLRLRSDALRA